MGIIDELKKNAVEADRQEERKRVAANAVIGAAGSTEPQKSICFLVVASAKEQATTGELKTHTILLQRNYGVDFLTIDASEHAKLAVILLQYQKVAVLFLASSETVPYANDWYNAGTVASQSGQLFFIPILASDCQISRTELEKFRSIPTQHPHAGTWLSICKDKDSYLAACARDLERVLNRWKQRI